MKMFQYSNSLWDMSIWLQHFVDHKYVFSVLGCVRLNPFEICELTVELCMRNNGV